MTSRLFEIDDLHLTNEIFWWSTLVAAVVDSGFAFLLVKSVKRERLHALKGKLVVIALVCFTLLWCWAIDNFWENVYRYVFPEGLRWFLPPAQGVLTAIIMYVIWRLALNFSGNAVANFCLLGGAWGAITHTWAVYRGIVAKPPMFQGVHPVPVIIFATFEFVFYWCLMLGIAAATQWAKDKIVRLRTAQVGHDDAGQYH